jgi:hypothetical protein
MRRAAFAFALFAFASCAHLPSIPFFKRTPKEPGHAAPTQLAPARVEKRSAVVAPAPDFALNVPGKNRGLRSLRGQAVVLLITRDVGVRPFKKQLEQLAPVYQEFAGKGVIFVAALEKGEGPVRSNIPFVTAVDGPGVAQRYGVTGKFAIAIIGRDGNIDYQTDQVLPGARVRDVIQNSFAVQRESRRR